MLQIQPLQEPEIVPALELIRCLLVELGSESEDAQLVDKFIQNKERLIQQPGHYIFVAKKQDELIGLITIAESFGIYAGGVYGTINEMYVKPGYRSQSTGRQLINAAKDFARKNRWMRLDVTAPIEERWQRTQDFYQNNGFYFTGEKLRCKISL